MKSFKLNNKGRHEYATRELDAFDLATYDHEHVAAVLGANARSLSDRVRRLEAALRRIATGDYPTDPHGHVAIAQRALAGEP